MVFTGIIIEMTPVESWCRPWQAYQSTPMQALYSLTVSFNLPQHSSVFCFKLSQNIFPATQARVTQHCFSPPLYRTLRDLGRWLQHGVVATTVLYFLRAVGFQGLNSTFVYPLYESRRSCQQQFTSNSLFNYERKLVSTY